nr:hypothetical protein [uncultured Carboxylicivirga sp.]
MKFKKLDIKSEGTWLTRVVKSKHFQKSVIYTLAGALIGVLVYYFTDAKSMSNIEINEVVNHIVVGGAFGLFITNSPCARGRC